ncbi:hypothetical protein C5167_011420 [Papaver somniferum]|uniref:Uncharacterized protein n=1 Tax=Papaver somniferum TaxID=3469 RepID=A0A4Y7K2Y9_PAPSO|nr:hypothetical protein C5167_011420 [Papaver somniferum]
MELTIKDPFDQLGTKTDHFVHKQMAVVDL